MFFTLTLERGSGIIRDYQPPYWKRSRPPLATFGRSPCIENAIRHAIKLEKPSSENIDLEIRYGLFQYKRFGRLFTICHDGNNLFVAHEKKFLKRTISTDQFETLHS